MASESTIFSLKGAVRWRIAALLTILIAVAAFGAFRWREEGQRKRWLETAPIDELSAAAAKNEQDIAVFEALGEKTRTDGQYARAARVFQHACELAPDRVQNFVSWARCIYEVEGYQPADAILTAFIARHPTDAKAYIERAALRRVAKRRESALIDAVKATELDAKMGEAWALRGDLSLDSGIAGEAEISFKKAQELMPDSPWGYIGLYQTYAQLRRFDSALDAARRVDEKFPSVKEAKLYLGEALVETAKSVADNEAARATLELAVKNEPEFEILNQFALKHLLGRTYVNQRRWAEAKTYLEAAQSIIPDNPENLFLLARVYRALGDKAKADAYLKMNRVAYESIAVMRQLVAKRNSNPNDAQTRLELARWYARRGALMNASVEYEEMIAQGLEVEIARRELKSLEKNGALP